MANFTTINKPSLYFNTLLYTGNGASPRAMTGVGFKPDWLWIKNRTGGTSYEHRQMDVVRGSNKVLHSSSNAAQNSEEYYTVGSFDSDGWTGRSGTGSQQSVVGGNDNGYNFVAWNWLAGGSSGSANTDGTINSTVSVNTTAGFSIVKFTGTGSAGTVGHGLGVAPKSYILKSMGDTSAWLVYHDSLDATAPQDYRLVWNQTTVRQDQTTWNDTAPTNSVFSVGSASEVNGNGVDRIVYCFAEKRGYNRFSSYIGNGNTNGTMVHTGFKPAWIMIKANDSEHWRVYDNKRDPNNLMYRCLFPNDPTTENTTNNGSEEIDFLSNGFKLRSSANQLNGNGTTYYFWAFAEEPLVGTNNVCSTAR